MSSTTAASCPAMFSHIQPFWASEDLSSDRLLLGQAAEAAATKGLDGLTVDASSMTDQKALQSCDWRRKKLRSGKGDWSSSSFQCGGNDGEVWTEHFASHWASRRGPLAFRGSIPRPFNTIISPGLYTATSWGVYQSNLKKPILLCCPFSLGHRITASSLVIFQPYQVTPRC